MIERFEPTNSDLMQILTIVVSMKEFFVCFNHLIYLSPILYPENAQKKFQIFFDNLHDTIQHILTKIIKIFIF